MDDECVHAAIGRENDTLREQLAEARADCDESRDAALAWEQVALDAGKDGG